MNLESEKLNVKNAIMFGKKKMKEDKVIDILILMIYLLGITFSLYIIYQWVLLN